MDSRWTSFALIIIICQSVENFEVTKLCRKRTSSLQGEELICHNASAVFFTTFDIALNKTHWLTCENCSLDTIGEDTFNISRNNIHYLYLITSQIRVVKGKSFVKFALLKVLNLRNNSIEDVGPAAFASLTKLAQLDLSHNHLRILSNNLFGDLPNLDLLNLNHNKIFYIQPEALVGLTNLKYLYLNNNEIGKLDAYTFRHLPNLLLLYLENNNIVQIDSFAFANLTRLNLLYLNNNTIEFLVPYNFKPLINLVDLQLRDNNLTVVQTSAFNGLTNLKFLYLGKNRLNAIKPYGFVGLNNLHNLELIGNKFQQLDWEYFKGLENLNMLWLQENQISNFTIDFKSDYSNTIRSLGLNDNNLTTLNYKLLYNKMPNIRDIFIANNSWKCEFLANMFNFFQEKSHVNLCVSSECSANKTRAYVEDVCATVEEVVSEEPDIDADFVTDTAGKPLDLSTIAPLLIFLSLLL